MFAETGVANDRSAAMARDGVNERLILLYITMQKESDLCRLGKVASILISRV